MKTYLLDIKGFFQVKKHFLVEESYVIITGVIITALLIPSKITAVILTTLLIPSKVIFFFSFTKI